MKRVLIIGGNGFLGSKIAEACLLQQWETDVVFHNATDHIPGGCRRIPFADIGNCDDSYDFVFLSTGNFSNSHKELLSNNVELSLLCVEKFLGARLVYISSINVYGDHPEVITERSSFNAPNTYGLSKISAEFVIMSHPRYAIVRPSVMLGKRIRTNTFIYRVISDARNKKVIDLIGTGERAQDYIAVQDVADICIKAAGATDNDIYLAVYGRSFSNVEIAKHIQGFTGCEIRYTGNETPVSYFFNDSYTSARLGATDKHNVLDVIRELYSQL